MTFVANILRFLSSFGPLLDLVDLRAFEPSVDVDPAVAAGIPLDQAPRREEDEPRFAAGLRVEIERQRPEHLVEVLRELHLDPHRIPAAAERMELRDPQEREELPRVDGRAHDPNRFPASASCFLASDMHSSSWEDIWWLSSK